MKPTLLLVVLTASLLASACGDLSPVSSPSTVQPTTGGTSQPKGSTVAILD